MKEKMFLTLISMYLLSLIFAVAVSADPNTHYGTIPGYPKPDSVTFIAYFTDDDIILTYRADEKAEGSGYNSGTGQWFFNDDAFGELPEDKEMGYIWIYDDSGNCYTNSHENDEGSPTQEWTNHQSSNDIEPPENLTATPGPPGTITLSWDPSDSGATKYTVYRNNTNPDENNHVYSRINTTSELTYVDSEVTYPQDPIYNYIVVGKDDSGNFGGHSNVAANADASKAVELSSFTALADDRKVTLKWETGSEVDNIGFYVYRSETKNGPFEKISELIEGAGNSAIGRTYGYIDKNIKPNKTYFYYLEDVDIHGIRNKNDTIQVTVPLPEKPPEENRLFQNYPNPFNPESWMPFQLAKGSEVNIRIYNVTGQLIKTIKLGSKQAGVYIEQSKAAHWNGRNDMGKKVASGVYFCELRAEKFRAIRKMILLK